MIVVAIEMRQSTLILTCLSIVPKLELSGAADDEGDNIRDARASAAPVMPVPPILPR